MGIFPDVLEQVYDIVIEHKLRHTGLDEAAPKLGLAGTTQSVILVLSFYVNSGVSFSGNNGL